MPRAPILGSAVVALFAGLWAALVRLGLDIPAPGPDVVALHGLLMTLGFLGTVIGLERAVAVGGFSYSAPVVTGIGALVTIAVAPVPGVALLTLGGVLFTVVALALLRREVSQLGPFRLDARRAKDDARGDAADSEHQLDAIAGGEGRFVGHDEGLAVERDARMNVCRRDACG